MWICCNTRWPYNKSNQWSSSIRVEFLSVPSTCAAGFRSCVQLSPPSSVHLFVSKINHRALGLHFHEIRGTDRLWTGEKLIKFTGRLRSRLAHLLLASNGAVVEVFCRFPSMRCSAVSNCKKLIYWLFIGELLRLVHLTRHALHSIL